MNDAFGSDNQKDELVKGHTVVHWWTSSFFLSVYHLWFPTPIDPLDSGEADKHTNKTQILNSLRLSDILTH